MQSLARVQPTGESQCQAAPAKSLLSSGRGSIYGLCLPEKQAALFIDQWDKGLVSMGRWSERGWLCGFVFWCLVGGLNGIEVHWSYDRLEQSSFGTVFLNDRGGV